MFATFYCHEKKTFNKKIVVILTAITITITMLLTMILIIAIIFILIMMFIIIIIIIIVGVVMVFVLVVVFVRACPTDQMNHIPLLRPRELFRPFDKMMAKMTE